TDALKKRVTDLTTAKDVPSLLRALPGDLETLATAIRLRREFEVRLNGIKAAFSGDLAPAMAAIEQLDSALKEVVGKAEGWATTLAKEVREQDARASAALTDAHRDPSRYRGAARAALLEAEVAHLTVQRVSLALSLLLALLQRTEPPALVPPGPAFDLPRLLALSRTLDRDVIRLSVTLDGLRADVPPDLAQWTSEQAPLYYFDSVDKLIKMLIPSATLIGTNALRDASDASTIALETATQELLTARAAVSDARREIAERQEDVRQAHFSLQDQLREAVAARDRARRDATTGDMQVQTAQMRVDTLQGQLDGAEGPLKTAQAKLDTALTAERTAAQSVRTSMGVAYVNALKDVRDFARARDSAPFLRTEPDLTAAQTDPVKRVMLAGFPDSRVLFIRGRKQDVLKVKQIVAQMDRPQAQALLTLYTLELNSDGSTRGAGKATKALQAIDEELRIGRGQVADVLDLLQDCVREEVIAAVKERRQWFNECKDSKQYDQAEIFRTPDDVLAARAFFHREVWTRLGWTDCFLKKGVGRGGVETKAPGVPRFLKAALPQPGRTSSLAETLLVLSLASQDRRYSIMERFKGRLQDTACRSAKELGIEKHLNDYVPKNLNFTNLYRFLDAEKPHFGGEELLTNFQQELLSALRRTPRTELFEYIVTLRERLSAAEQREADLNEALRVNSGNEVLKGELATITGRINNLRGELLPLTDWLTRVYEVSAAAGLASETDQIERALDATTRTPADNAREAVINDQLKAMVQGVDDDMRRLFIEPMFDRIRKRIVKEDVGVGVVNRTSVLGSNRLVARVDPRASANLAMGDDLNVLEGALQLFQFGGGIAAGGLPGAIQGLQQLDRQRKPPPPAIYGLGTGNLFEVTPIGDPSGQAVRFRFDFVSQTQIREPSGVTDPQLPRIERHSVNTEVQVSNLEVREFSRFQTNAKLGLPTRKSGGIPILKDLPLIKEIPLVGWFSKRTGKAASVQQNLIVGQTTILPTIADVFQLLSDPTAVPLVTPARP
ncbi:MAG: hypothetical protein ACO1SX_12790, partial [Actinomycetota bacterium]